MAKDFNIILHRHLTECDLILQSIPFRDGISVTDRIIIDAVLQGTRLMRLVAAQSNIEMVAELDRIIKTCLERLDLSIAMDASVDMKATRITSPVVDPVVMNAENLGTLETVLERAEAGMVMSVSPLVTKISKSLGTMGTSIIADASVSDTLKRSILTLRQSLGMDADIVRDVKTGFLDINTDITMDATLASLCKRLMLDASAGIEMTAVLLGTRIFHSLGRAYFGIAADAKVTGTKAQKIEAAEGVIQMMVDMKDVLTVFLDPESCATDVDAQVSGSQLKRYRLFSDLDDVTFGDIDDMTLGELDYIILAE